ncbi:MAG TPA: hypothetical protein VMI56_05260 [Reyranella sp.]|nr:hypothetical protein [Reyranella sp.]
MGREEKSETEPLKRLAAALGIEPTDALPLIDRLKDNPTCSMFFDDEVPCVTVVWKGSVTSSQLRCVHENLIHLIAAHRVSKVLGDDTALPTIDIDDQRWILDDWMPRAAAAGLKAAASKAPDSYIARVSIDNIIQANGENMTIRSFGDIGEARRWLREYQV